MHGQAAHITLQNPLLRSAVAGSAAARARVQHFSPITGEGDHICKSKKLPMTNAQCAEG
jgi:hypothetical protein